MADRKLTIALALFALVLVATDVAAEFAPSTWLFRDGRFYLNVNENLLENGSLEDPFAASWYDGQLGWNRSLGVDFSNLALGARGEHYHFRPWILPILSTPFYFAFGLVGVLLFNCVLYALVAAASYRFVRAYTSAVPSGRMAYGQTAAAVTAVAMVMASGFRHHIYNYSVDMLLVTAFLCGLWGLMEKKGVLAGVLVASTVMIKPTVLLYAPALALVMWERNDGRTLLRAIQGGSALLAVYGCINWYMFGRPWWTGYTRTLVVENGEEAVYTNTNSFEVPLEDGARDLLTGADGVVWWHGLFILALPGMAVLLRRFPRTGIAVLLSSIGAYALFSKFQWHHDRFLFPTVALLALPLALGMRHLGEHLRSLASNFAKISSAGALLFAVALTAIIASAFTGGALPTRHPDEAAINGAIAMGQGSFDLAPAAGPSSDVTVFTVTEGSTVSRTRWGAWAPRGNPLALAVLAPLGRGFGRYGVLVGSSFAMAALIAALAWLLRRRLPTPLAAAVALGALLVGPMREAALGRPLETMSALFLVLAVARAVHEESDTPQPFVSSAVLAGLSGVVIEQPLLGLLGTAGIVLLCRFRGAPLVLPVALAGLGATAVGLLSSAYFWGHPLASAEASVVVAPDGTLAAIAPATLEEALVLLAEGPSLSRAAVPLLFSLPLGALVLLSLRPVPKRFVIGSMVLTAALLVPGVALRNGALTPLTITVLVAASGLAIHGLAARIAGVVASHGARRVVFAGALTAAMLLAAAGLARRAQARAEPFWIGSVASVRSATVLLGDAPCDFLAWENMAWECAMLDGGRDGRVGLALPEGMLVDGRPARNMLLVPTGLRRSDRRTVRWRNVPAGPALHLVVAAPDGPFTSPALVTVRIDGTEVGTFEVPRIDAGFRDVVLDTRAFMGRSVVLELVMEARNRGQQAAFLVTGGFTRIEGGSALGSDAAPDAGRDAGNP